MVDTDFLMSSKTYILSHIDTYNQNVLSYLHLFSHVYSHISLEADILVMCTIFLVIFTNFVTGTNDCGFLSFFSCCVFYRKLARPSSLIMKLNKLCLQRLFLSNHLISSDKNQQTLGNKLRVM